MPQEDLPAVVAQVPAFMDQLRSTDSQPRNMDSPRPSPVDIPARSAALIMEESLEDSLLEVSRALAAASTAEAVEASMAAEVTAAAVTGNSIFISKRQPTIWSAKSCKRRI
jgi:hypothetical protein